MNSIQSSVPCQIGALQLSLSKFARLYNKLVWGLLTCRHMHVQKMPAHGQTLWPAGSAGEGQQTFAMGQWLAFSMHQNTGLWGGVVALSMRMHWFTYPSHLFLFPLLLFSHFSNFLHIIFGFWVSFSPCGLDGVLHRTAGNQLDFRAWHNEWLWLGFSRERLGVQRVEDLLLEW